MSYNSINKVDINGVEYILHDLTDGTYIVEIPALTKDETFAIQSKVNSDLYKKVDKVSGKELSTNDFTNEYKSKIDGIEDNANKYIHPSYTAYVPGFYKVTVDDKGHVSSAVKVEKSDITALGIPGQDTTYVDMVGATSSADGKNGLVPAPSKGDATRYLRSDGTWVVPPDTTYPLATTSDKGLMSKEDKDKLDKIEASANNYSLPIATGTELGGVKIGENVSISNSIISVANASTSKKGVVQLNSSIESNSETTAATSKAVKLINDKVNSLDTTTNAALPKSGGTMTGAINMGNNKITNVASPTNNADAANKQYVDSVVPNLNVDIDSALSITSTNPVQNKIITESLHNKANKSVPSAGGNVAALTASGDLSDTGLLLQQGTWTPVVSGAATYSGQVGTYARIGKLVLLQFYVYGNFGGDSTEKIVITGCPIMPESTSGGGGTLSGYTAASNIVFAGWNINQAGKIFPIGQETGTVEGDGNKWASDKIYQKSTGDFSATGTLMFQVT